MTIAEKGILVTISFFTFDNRNNTLGQPQLIENNFGIKAQYQR